MADETYELPSWADELRARYLSGESAQFILHANVDDLVPWQGRYVPLRQFLYEGLLRSTKDVVVFYNPSEGLTFRDKTASAAFFKAIDVSRTLSGDASLSGPLPRDPAEAIPLLEEYLFIPGQRCAILIDYAETVIPGSDLGFLGSADRANLIAFQRWSADPRLLSSDKLVILITENLADINRRVISSPHLSTIRIPLPDEASRLDYIRFIRGETGVELAMPEERLAQVTAGLTCIQIGAIFQQGKQSGTPITFDLVRMRKRAIIEDECSGLVEFVEPQHGLDMVGGLDEVKTALRKIADDVRNGNTRRVPMGILFVGPMGTGKTFVAEAFAHDSGLTCLKLANFRDKWVGSTEGNLEKIINVVNAMGYVLVIIDEGDRSLGGGQQEGDSGTSSRVLARLKEFMSDTSHRGRVIFLMMTNRPDKLDTDMKRPGRFDRKMPFFAPASVEERERILEVLFTKNGITGRSLDLSVAAARTEGYAGADIEAVVLLADEIAAAAGRKSVSEQDMEAALQDFIPSREAAMLEYMELLAVFECSSRRMLPARFRDIDGETLNQRLSALRAAHRF